MKKRTPIIGSILAATMFLSIGIGTTLALYTSEKSVNVHLVSGSLDAGLYLTNMTRDELTEDGEWIVDKEVAIEEWEGYDADKKGVDLEVYSEALFEDVKLVPQMKGSASFILYNYGDVAFNYTVSVVNESADDELSEQLTITKPEKTGTLLVGKSVEFELSYEFTSSEDNNDAMDQTVTFDISVVCTQVERPTQTNP